MALRQTWNEKEKNTNCSDEGVMTSFRRFCCDDLLRFASVNLDHITDTVSLSFYMEYLIHWPDYFQVAVAPGNRVMGYFIGRVVGEGVNWYGHVTALTIAPEYRKLELATGFLNMFEEHMCDKMFFSPSNHPYSMNLFVSVTNIPAIKFCQKLGYVIYQQVVGYFSDDEDAYNMTKSLENDFFSMQMATKTDGNGLQRSMISAVFSFQLGFHVFEHMPDLYADGADSFEMRKTLTQAMSECELTS